MFPAQQWSVFQNGTYINFARDGIPVPMAEFMAVVNSGQVGGQFGLLQMTLRMSVNHQVWDWRGNRVYSGSSFEQASYFARRTETKFMVRTNYEVDWSIMRVISPAQQTQAQTVEIRQQKVTVESHPYQRKLVKNVTNRLKSPKCKKALDDLVKKLGYKGSIDSLFNALLERDGLLSATKKFSTYNLGIADAYAVGGREGVVVFNYYDYDSNDKDAATNLDGYLRTQAAITLIHELLHLAGNGADHTKIAKEMFKLSNKYGDTPISLRKQNVTINNGQPVIFSEPADKSNSKGFDPDSVNSNYMNKWINTYCPEK